MSQPKHRPPGLGEIVIASGNTGKIAELQALLAGLGVELKAQSAFGVPAVEEIGITFVENALLKARNAAAHGNLPAIADDSGLCVDALHGAPGVYSARYAGPASDDDANNRKLLTALAALPLTRRGAHFHCTVVFLRHAKDPAPLIAQGEWPGHILTAPRGGGGFGYDPLFWVADEGMSAAELAPERKNAISHRGRAMAALVAALTDGTAAGQAVS